MVRKALEQEPENGAYLDSLGWVFFQKGDLKKSEKYLLQAIGFVKDPEIYAHLGELYFRLGDEKKASAYLDEGLTRFPDNRNLKEKSKEYGKEDSKPKD